MDDRKQREQDFHDARFGAEDPRSSDKFYSITVASTAAYGSRIREAGAGKSVLEYGCGPGSAAFDLAASGSEVIGIDISPVAIDIARAEAARRGVAARFETMDAESLTFADASFDLVCGSGILHHLTLDKAYAQVARVLRPGGTAYFTEPLGHNPVINAYRDRTPDQRTSDEHPLVVADFELARRYFSGVTVRYYHLLTLAALPLAAKSFVRPIASTLDAADRALFAVAPILRKYAWVCLMELTGPKPAATSRQEVSAVSA